jgi:hypothetical protein
MLLVPHRLSPLSTLLLLAGVVVEEDLVAAAGLVDLGRVLIQQ